MGDEPSAFLTETRRAVLEGNYTGQENTYRTHKARIRARSQAALEELVEVAQSPYIDNTEAFDTENIAMLIHALFVPDFGHIEGGGLVTDPRADTDDDTNYPTASYEEDYQEFRDRLYVALDKPMREYRDSRFPDPDTGNN